MVDFGNHVLLLFGVHQLLNLLQASILSCPQQVLIISLLLLPPVAPGIPSLGAALAKEWCMTLMRGSGYVVYGDVNVQACVLRCDVPQVSVIAEIV